MLSFLLKPLSPKFCTLWPPLDSFHRGKWWLLWKYFLLSCLKIPVHIPLPICKESTAIGTVFQSCDWSRKARAGRKGTETHADVLLELHVTIRSVFPGVSTGWRMVGPFSIYWVRLPPSKCMTSAHVCSFCWALHTLRISAPHISCYKSLSLPRGMQHFLVL